MCIRDRYEAIDEATDMIDDDIETDIQGYDADASVLRAARRNAEEAGVGHLIHFQQREVKDLSHPKKYGFIITNPRTANVLRKKKLFRNYIKNSETPLKIWIVGRRI